MGSIRRTLAAVGALSASLALIDCAPPRRNNEGPSVGEPTPTTSSGSSAPLRSAPTATAQVTPPAEATVVEARCDAAAPESCNGLDDNCNGRIDEGCGYNSGGLQVTVSWQTDADINLVVTDPQNNEVSEGHNSPSGGALDQTANFNCVRSRPTLENAVWSAPRPPQGRYEVRLTAFDMCNADATPATVSISVGGRVVGTWRVEFTYARQEMTFGLAVR